MAFTSISCNTPQRVEKLEKKVWRFNFTLFTGKLGEAFMKNPLKCPNLPQNNLNNP